MNIPLGMPVCVSCRREPSHTIFLFSIWTELYQNHSSNPSFLRSLLRSAVTKQASNSSLWILYIHFEMQIAPLRAKQIFYEAIASCPCSKSLHLIPFHAGPLRDHFSTEELEQVYETLQDKEIRLHNFYE
jgi:hypothetical protein